MTTALVTGGTGFIGAHISRVLIEAGYTTRVLHRATSPLTALEGLNVEHALGDVIDPVSLAAAMVGCDWVFHVAAIADYWRADKARMYHVNVDGTRLVLEAAQRAGVKRVMLTSSAAAVGKRTDGRPPDESVYYNLDPARLPYGHTKFLAEVEAYRAIAHGLDVVILNPTAVMGPGDLNQISGSILIELRRGGVPAMPPGSATLIDVRDVAAAHLAAAQFGRTGERYLLGAFDVAWRALTPLAAEVVGVRPPRLLIPSPLAEPIALGVDALRSVGLLLPIDGNQIRLSAQEVLFDCQKTWRELGKPRIGLRQMLQDTFDWYIAHGLSH